MFKISKWVSTWQWNFCIFALFRCCISVTPINTHVYIYIYARLLPAVYLCHFLKREREREALDLFVVFVQTALLLLEPGMLLSLSTFRPISVLLHFSFLASNIMELYAQFDLFCKFRNFQRMLSSKSKLVVWILNFIGCLSDLSSNASNWLCNCSDLHLDLKIF